MPPESIDLTIGICTLNEESTIDKAIRALLPALNSIDGEFVVVAGGTDGTLDVAGRALSQATHSRLIEQFPRGKPAALNQLFPAARGRLLVLSDGDVIVRPGAVDSLLRRFGGENIGCVSGRVVGTSGNYGSIEKVCAFITEMFDLSRKDEFKRKGTIDLASGYLLAIRRDLVQPLPEDISSDDGFLSMTVRSLGMRIAYAEEATVEIHFPKTFSDFLHQKRRTRLGHLQLKTIFPLLSSRSPIGELREYMRFRKAPELRHYTIGTRLLALVLVSFAWIMAGLMLYLRISRKRIWSPVSSTKQ